MADIELTTTASIPANTSASIKVYEDTDNDGVAENTVTQSISDGTNTYTLSGFVGGEGTGYDYWWELTTFSTSDITTTPSITSVEIETLPGGQVVSVSITENNIAGDSYTTIANVASSLTESISAGDSDTAPASALGSISESSIGNDLLDVVSQVSSSVIEGAQAGELWASKARALVDLVENGTADETILNSADDVRTAAIDENSVASNQFLASIKSVNSFTANAVAGDSWSIRDDDEGYLIISAITLTAALSSSTTLNPNLTSTTKIESKLSNEVNIYPKH